MRDEDILALGQVGYRININSTLIYIDPYLSNSVQEKEDSEIGRLVPIPVKPQEISDADIVLITHAHRDHCDEDTLIPLAKASSKAIFIGPRPVCLKLSRMGISEDRIVAAESPFLELPNSLKIHVVPAAHPEIKPNESGDGWQCVGYVIETESLRLYHAGDTSLREEIIDCIRAVGSIDIAMIPVNEQNYMREKQGIIGNMSVREAFYMGAQIGAQKLIPTHWDMFAQNQVYKEEIELLYNLISPPFDLQFKEVAH